MLLADVAATSQAVASTRSRLAKVAALAELVRRLEPAEVALAVGYLMAAPRQGRVGVGWSTLRTIDPSPAEQPSITVGELDAALDVVAATTGVGSIARRTAILGSLLARATADEQLLIRSVLMGELRQGALDGVLAEAIAVAAEVPGDLARRAYMLTGDLGQTARLALAGGSAALAAVRLEVLRPVRPMLASTATSVREALAATGLASVEHKLDGARIQVHCTGDEVRVFTRNLADVTHRLADVADLVREFPARSFVLDGESLTLDADARPRAFQDTMRRFGADGPRDQVLRPYFFDILELDGADLLDRPLVERLAALQRVAATGRIPGTVTDDPTVGEQVLADALAAGHEGVMIKSITSPYAAGRRGSAWQKVKPVRTLDLVVLAAEWGHGRRTGWLSNLHLGARDADGTYGEPGGLVMVGKTFKGLTDALLTWQTKALRQLEERQTAGTVWVRPALVVEIALDGAQVSPRYPGGVALRFARVVRYREDKTPAEADTIETVRALRPGVSAAS